MTVMQRRPQTGLPIRDVTDEEVATFERNGWVKLEGLISPEVAGQMLAVASDTRDRLRESDGDAWLGKVGRLARDRQVEPFYSVVMGPQMGRAASRLINRSRLTEREVPVRHSGEALFCKEPVGMGLAAAPTYFHQDLCVNNWQDRVGSVAFWIALAEVTPAHGAMRFVTGSHREGPLGYDIREHIMGPDFEAVGVLAAYPKLLDIYDLSPPLHYRPGDATVHHCNMIHGAPQNVTDEPRWAYVFDYIPADLRYNGAPSLETGRPGTDLDAGELFEHKNFPIVYPASV